MEVSRLVHGLPIIIKNSISYQHGNLSILPQFSAYDTGEITFGIRLHMINLFE